MWIDCQIFSSSEFDLLKSGWRLAWIAWLHSLLRRLRTICIWLKISGTRSVFDRPMLEREDGASVSGASRFLSLNDQHCGPGLWPFGDTYRASTRMKVLSFNISCER